jgi:hypothetical protein
MLGIKSFEDDIAAPASTTCRMSGQKVERVASALGSQRC